MTENSDRAAWQVRVPFHHIDMHGHMHNSAYFPYCETAIAEYLRQQGLGEAFSPIQQDHGYHVHKVEFVFHRPSRYEQLLSFVVEITRLRNTSMTFRVSVYGVDENTPRVEASIVWVCVHNQLGKIQPIPVAVQRLLTTLMQDA